MSDLDPGEAVTVGAGAALALFVLLDVGLTTLHLDVNGPLTRGLQWGIWRVALALAEISPRGRRQILSLAGPSMMVMTFLTWIVLFILGFALVYWPFLAEGFHLSPQQDPPDFFDALYFSGNTGTVLGYGDIVPVRPAVEILAIVESTFGFLLLGGIVTYAFNVLSGVTRRNVVAVHVQGQTGGTGDGVRLVALALQEEDPNRAARRLDEWAHSLRRLYVDFQRLPVLVFFYRSTEAVMDPEPMLETMMEAALAARLVGPPERARALHRAAERYEAAHVGLMETVASKHMRSNVRRELASPDPGEEDYAYVQEIRDRLRGELGEAYRVVPAKETPKEVVAFAARSRLFLRQVDELTHWRRTREAAQ